MPKFYLTDGDNRLTLSAKTHLHACSKYIKYWEEKQKAIGKFISYGNRGFDSISENDRVDTKFVKGLKLEDGHS